MITRRLMKPGTFSLKLVESAPYRIYSAVALADHIVFTHVKLDPIEGYSDANILSAALYTGVVTKLPTPTDIQGADLSWWWGTPKGFGPGTAATQGLLTTPVTNTAATLSTWVTALCPPGLTVGTVTNTGLSTLTNTYQFVTRREALDDVCRKLGAEYRINPNGTIDAAAPGTLFGSTPSVIVTRKDEGRDGALQGLEGSVITTAVDIEDYITKAVVVTRGTGSATTATTSTGSTSYRDLVGNTTHVERYIDAPSELAANASLIGTAALNRFNVSRRDLRLSSRTYNVTRTVTPGSYVYAYDLAAGLTDGATQVQFRGDLITPITVRVFGLTFPIQRGMGVYARRSTGVGTATYTDLSDHVMWEDGDTSWEVGASRRPLVGTAGGSTSEGTVAYLGANPQVTARASAAGDIVAEASATATSSANPGTTGLLSAPAFTAQTNRRYKATITFYDAVIVGAGTTDVQVRRGGGATTIGAAYVGATAGTFPGRSCTWFDTPGAGSVTYVFYTFTNATSIQIEASAAAPYSIVIEDAGPG